MTSRRPEEIIGEWGVRDVTPASQDERARLDRDATSLPLASLLEGGSWTAGRAAAYARRADGSPPIKVISDGTVF